ncbi:MAG: hypothetical protein RLZZ502_647 [Pseudomonadota bacterium]|jgi:hypothetical protein
MKKNQLPLGPMVCFVVGGIIGLYLLAERMARAERIEYVWFVPLLFLLASIVWSIIHIMNNQSGGINPMLPRNAEEAQQAIMRLTSKQKQLLTFIALRRPVYREVEAWARNNSIAESELHFRLESLALRGLYGRKSDGYQERRLVVASACEQVLRGEYLEDKKLSGVKRGLEEIAENATAFGDPADRERFLQSRS